MYQRQIANVGLGLNSMPLYTTCSGVEAIEFGSFALLKDDMPISKRSFNFIVCCRARQRCFWLLAFISRPQVKDIHLLGRMILPGSLIPSHKCFLKNLTFVVRISTRVATSPFQSNSLRGQDEEQTTKKQCPSWPTGLPVR